MPPIQTLRVRNVAIFMKKWLDALTCRSELRPRFLDLPFDYSTLVEASLDPSRAAFTHHPTLPRSEAGPLLFRMDNTVTQEGFNASWMPPAAQVRKCALVEMSLVLSNSVEAALAGCPNQRRCAA